MCGAAPLSAELGDAVIARMKQRGGKSGIAEGFGLSETSPTATYESYKTHQDSKGSCGRLLPGVEARIVDADGKDVGHEQGKDGKPGELWLRGPTIMKGYLNRPDATADCIDKDGFFHTVSRVDAFAHPQRLVLTRFFRRATLPSASRASSSTSSTE